MTYEELATLDDSKLLAIARKVKSYERSDDLSDLVLLLGERLTRALESSVRCTRCERAAGSDKWMYEDLNK